MTIYFCLKLNSQYEFKSKFNPQNDSTFVDKCSSQLSFAQGLQRSMGFAPTSPKTPHLEPDPPRKAFQVRGDNTRSVTRAPPQRVALGPGGWHFLWSFDKYVLLWKRVTAEISEFVWTQIDIRRKAHSIIWFLITHSLLHFWLENTILKDSAYYASRIN